MESNQNVNPKLDHKWDNPLSTSPLLPSTSPSLSLNCVWQLNCVLQLFEPLVPIMSELANDYLIKVAKPWLQTSIKKYCSPQMGHLSSEQPILGIARGCGCSWRRIWPGSLQPTRGLSSLRRRQGGFFHPLVLLPTSSFAPVHWLASLSHSRQAPPDFLHHQLAWGYMEPP